MATPFRSQFPHTETVLTPTRTKNKGIVAETKNRKKFSSTELYKRAGDCSLSQVKTTREPDRQLEASS